MSACEDITCCEPAIFCITVRPPVPAPPEPEPPAPIVYHNTEQSYTAECPAGEVLCTDPLYADANTVEVVNNSGWLGEGYLGTDPFTGMIAVYPMVWGYCSWKAIGNDDDLPLLSPDAIWVLWDNFNSTYIVHIYIKSAGSAAFYKSDGDLTNPIGTYAYRETVGNPIPPTGALATLTEITITQPGTSGSSVTITIAANDPTFDSTVSQAAADAAALQAAREQAEAALICD